jgi:CRP/FNR family transcriptional regulator, anaerobic regulatory protein
MVVDKVSKLWLRNNLTDLRITELNTSIALRDELKLGRRELTAKFRGSPRCAVGTGEPLTPAGRVYKVLYYLVEGWACRFHRFSDGRQAIVDVYLPGDIIGLDAISRTRSLEEVIALTSIVAERIDGEQPLADLMTCRSIALYISWLLGKRQQRTERHLAAVSSLDARGRLATMALDFYTRLSGRGLITGLAYSLPLTQVHIAAYLGLTAVHLNRVLRSLHDEQIVSLERHCLTILDISRLKTLAQKCPQPSAGFDQQVFFNPAEAAPKVSSPDMGGLPIGSVATATGFV